MTQKELVERYYAAIDGMDGDDLSAILVPEFCHDRPDRSIEGRTQFVTFMLEGRPQTDTVHAIDTVFFPDGVDANDHRTNEVAVHGRLLDKDEAELFTFIDLFTVKNREIIDLRTFTS